MLELIDIFYAFQASVVGVVFVYVLQSEKMIFERYGDALDAFEGKYKYAYWITKPLGNCATCFTGQIAAWGWVWTHYKNFDFYELVNTIIFISTSILVTQILKKSIR